MGQRQNSGSNSQCRRFPQVDRVGDSSRKDGFTMPIRYFDMFAGIGGFRSALEAIGGFECVGYCEIDKYARQAYEAMYNTEGELFFEDATKIVPEQLPDIDLICGGLIIMLICL